MRSVPGERSMKKDPEREAARWFAQAEAELKDARYLSDGGRYYLALFLAQQSAEKAVKAFPFFRNIDPIFTHSVTELLGTAEILDKDFHRMNYPAAELRGIKFSPLNPRRGTSILCFLAFKPPSGGLGGCLSERENNKFHPAAELRGILLFERGEETRCVLHPDQISERASGRYPLTILR